MLQKHFRSSGTNAFCSYCLFAMITKHKDCQNNVIQMKRFYTNIFSAIFMTFNHRLPPRRESSCTSNFRQSHKKKHKHYCLHETKWGYAGAFQTVPNGRVPGNVKRKEPLSYLQQILSIPFANIITSLEYHHFLWRT